MTTEWHPPFCAQDTKLECPKCNAPNAVCVREKEYYQDGDEVEAYCVACHAPLRAYVSVEIDFHDAEAEDVESEDDGS